MIEEVEDRAFGGVLVDADGRLCLVRPTGRGLWALPKGHAEPGETPEAAALREVLEETGCPAALELYLGAVEYSYPARRGDRPVSIRKSVRFWLMRLAGSPGPRRGDGEVEAITWLPLPEALAALGYPTERGLVASSRDRLARAPSAPA